MVAEPSKHSLHLTRWYSASPAAVYRVWTDPDYIRLWFKPTEQFTHDHVEMDVRVGGRYRIGFRSPEGKTDCVCGEFLEVAPPNRLVYSWVWDEPNAHAGVQSEVTVSFTPEKDGTRLELHHVKLTGEGMPDEHALGWSGAIDQIQAVVDTLPPEQA